MTDDAQRPMMRKKFTLYGWHLSYFTGKVLCYLRYKRIPFDDQPVDMLTLMHRIKRETGEVVMPVLRTPDNEWLQDSSHIIDRMEAQFPDRPVIPVTPVQRFTAYLIEAWGDEWWIPVAMHTRWTYPENYALFESDAGSALLPRLPRFLQRMAVKKVAGTLRAMLPAVGVRREQFAVMDAWTTQMLDLLDSHFAVQPFLLGARPTLADYGLVGTMYGHLGRDPWPARELIAPRKNLHAWLQRMAHPTASNSDGELLADDAIAPTLEPILRSIFTEFVPMLEAINHKLKAVLPTQPEGKRIARGLGDIRFPMGSGHFQRAALPFTLWMAQRVLDVYHAMPAGEQLQIAERLAPLGGAALLALDIPRLRRAGLRVVADQRS